MVRPFLGMNRRSFLLSVCGVFATSHRATATSDRGLVITGQLTDGGDEGYYALGQELALIARPGKTADLNLRPLVSKDVTLTVLPE